MVDDKKLLDTRIVMPGIRLAYTSSLIVPKAFEAGQQLKYGGTFLLPPDHPAIDQIDKLAIAVATARWGKREDWPKPLKGITRDPIVKDCTDYRKIGDLPLGWCFVRAYSTEPPLIVDHRVQPLNKADLVAEVYSGRWAAASVNVYAYEFGTISKGVSLGLGNIQLLKHDTRLGTPRPRPADEFDPEDLPDTDNDDDDLKPARRPRQR